MVALVEGDDDAVADFKKLVEAQKPERSKVSKITFGDYDGEVMRASEYAQVCTALQMNKAIPVLLEIRDNTRAIQENTKSTPQILEEIRDNTRAIHENTKSTPGILEEVKGLREDVQPGFAMQFRQMQADVRAIKERLGMA